MTDSTRRPNNEVIAELDEQAMSDEQSSSSESGKGRTVGTLLLGILLGVAATGAYLVLRDDSTEESVACESGVEVDGICEPVEEESPQNPVDSADVLVWSDEFDSLDTSVWKLEHSTFGDGNDELQCYTPNQVEVRDGKLVLLAEERPIECPNGSLRSVTSGMVRSTGPTLEPGQFIEWRVKLTPADADNQGGLWPAVWSSSWAGGSWPMGGEWDGFEVMTANNPNRVTFGIHYADASGSHGKTSKEIFGERFSDDWHEFRFDYGTDGVLVWYLDGVETHRVTDAPTSQGYPAPFDQAMRELRINLALGGRPGPLDTRALPATLEVDYVRIYELP